LLREELAALKPKLAAADGEGRVRWVRADSWHLTLRFLGAVEAETLAPLMRLVGEAVSGLRAFDVGVGELQLFPKPRRPRVVTLGLRASPALADLAERVDDACCRVGFAREERRFRPHLTLGRVREGVPVLPAPWPSGFSPLAVREVVLLQSHLGAGGARYEPLSAIPLAGGPGRGSKAPPEGR